MSSDFELPGCPNVFSSISKMINKSPQIDFLGDFLPCGVQ